MRYFSGIFGPLGGISRPRPFLDVFLCTCFSVRIQVTSVYSGKSRQLFLSSCLDVELYHDNFCNKT